LNKSLAKAFIMLLIALALALPVILYVYTFGFYLSTDHEKWAEFGSAMSGIYSPLIAFAALFILIIQSQIQRSMNKHQHDQSFIQRTRDDIDFFIGKLETYLNYKYDDESSIKEYITSKYAYIDEVVLDSPQTARDIKDFNLKHQYIVDIWLALYPLLNGLEANKAYPYEHNFSGSKLRISSCLSYATCVAIDNMYYSITNDSQKGRYYFKQS